MKRFFLFFLSLPLFLASREEVVDLHGFGKILYYIEDGLCEKVVRLSPSGEAKYEHLYHYDSNRNLVGESLIGGLGKIEFSGNLEEGCLVHHTPFGDEQWSKDDSCTFEESDIEKRYDDEGHLIQKGENRYFYKDDKLMGVLTDHLKVRFAYDEEGKRIAKRTISQHGEDEEFYLFIGKHEVSSLSKEGALKWLRIPGMTIHQDLVRAIAIETEDTIYAPIYDSRWNIVKLVNIENGAIIDTRPDPFGQNLNELDGCPWTFQSKRYDPDVGLVNFGYRDYDPELRKWTSLDPLKQDNMPYRYCFDNPMQFIDPDGRWSLAVTLVSIGGAATSPAWGTAALAFGGGALVGYGIKKGYDYYKEWQEEQKREESWRIEQGWVDESHLINKKWNNYQYWQEGQQNKEPPFTWEDLGDDPNRCPDEGFVWKGRGSPESGKGSWFNPETGESLHPDINHPDHGPHWDYENRQTKEKGRIYPDDRWETK